MALQTFVHQHEPPYGYNNDKDFFNMLPGSWSYNLDDLPITFNKEDSFEDFEVHKTTDADNSATNYLMAPLGGSELEIVVASQNGPNDDFPVVMDSTTTTTSNNVETRSRRRRRWRRRTKRNGEEIENQRMAHIEVERNRRKQMNEYLSLLRGLMPLHYVLKADQASTVGGAINYVKELEQQLQFLGSQRHLNPTNETGSSSSSSSPFSEFFTFPQYSTGFDHHNNMNMAMSDLMNDPFMDKKMDAVADIEVTMVESHANLKVRSRKRPKQLLKMVSCLQSLRLTILHLNVTTADQVVLYSLSLKVENDCNLTSVDDIAAAVNQILSRIQEEAGLSA